MTDAGFQEVTEVRYKLPIGGWSKDKKLKEIGMYNRLCWEQGIEGWCLYLLTRYLHWEYAEVMIYVAQMRKMLRDKTVHAYHDWYVDVSSSYPGYFANNTLALWYMLESHFERPKNDMTTIDEKVQFQRHEFTNSSR